MLCFTRQAPLRLANPSPQPGRERLRHLVISSPEGCGRRGIQEARNETYWIGRQSPEGMNAAQK